MNGEKCGVETKDIDMPNPELDPSSCIKLDTEEK